MTIFKVLICALKIYLFIKWLADTKSDLTLNILIIDDGLLLMYIH